MSKQTVVINPIKIESLNGEENPGYPFLELFHSWEIIKLTHEDWKTFKESHKQHPHALLIDENDEEVILVKVKHEQDEGEGWMLRSELEEIEAGIEIINRDSNIGNYQYPALNLLDDWMIAKFTFKAWTTFNPNNHSLDDCFILPRDNGVTVIKGRMEDSWLGHEELIELLGLEISSQKGPFVYAKRLTRMLTRPYRYWMIDRRESVDIFYDPSITADQWDGAGQVSRAFVRELAYSANLDLDDRQRRRLAKANRLDGVIMTPEGQDKGHFWVVDGLEHDFVLPTGGTKQEAKFAGIADSIFIGLDTVKAHKHMGLDIQSLINLGGEEGFFQPAQLLAWLQMATEKFIVDLKTGRDVETMIRRLTNVESEEELDKIESWYVSSYLASGGRPCNFPGIVNALARAWRDKLYHKVQKKFRFPIPGCRLYIFPASVGNKVVPEGQVTLDFKGATLWVNDKDFKRFIGEETGGADFDDAYWVVPFTDHDGSKQVLAWRSPNQLGEYVLLEPTEESDELAWQTSMGEIKWPVLDSSNLPPRISNIKTQYLDLVIPAEGFEEVGYSQPMVFEAIEKAIGNQAVLGALVNLMMVVRAIKPEWLPKTLPATLEQVIDGSVKTGDDLSQVMKWIEQMVKALVKKNAIPKCMVDRIAPSLSASEKRNMQIDKHNWVQLLQDEAASHLDWFKAETDALAMEAFPPITLIEAGQAYVKAGETLRKAYGRVINPNSMEKVMKIRNEAERATALKRLFQEAHSATMEVIGSWPVEAQKRAVAGAITAIFTNIDPDDERPGYTDAVLWQQGDGESSFADLTLQVLREHGVIGTPVWNNIDRVVEVAEPQSSFEQGLVPIRLDHVWFNVWRNQLADNVAKPERMRDVDEELRNQLKDEMWKMLGVLVGTRLTIEKEKDRFKALNNGGSLFAFAKGAVSGLSDVEIVAGKVDDGNLLALIRPV